MTVSNVMLSSSIYVPIEPEKGSKYVFIDPSFGICLLIKSINVLEDLPPK
jgi:hypothetical protein